MWKKFKLKKKTDSTFSQKKRVEKSLLLTKDEHIQNESTSGSQGFSYGLNILRCILYT